MAPEIFQPLIAAAIVLAIAVLSYLTAWVRQNTKRLDMHEGALAGRPGQPPPRAARVSDAAGGAQGPRPAPLWNQLADPLSDGTLPGRRINECGEECCAMEIARQHGVPLSADALRYLLGGARRGALTTAPDLVRCLALCNVPSAAEAPGRDQVAARLQVLTAAGGTAIVLGEWVTPGVLHWVLVTRSDAQGCSANDPWEGRRRSWPWAAFRDVYAGELVVSARPPDPLT